MKPDEQVLAQAMGIGWKCQRCGDPDCKVRPTFTDPAELWNLLMYMVNRKDWNEFYVFSWYEYHEEQNTSGKCSTLPAYMRWLLTDPARFVHLCADWCREKEVKE